MLDDQYKTKERMSTKEQIEVLGKFIMEKIEGEPSQSQGAIDTAIRLLNDAYLEGA